MAGKVSGIVRDEMVSGVAVTKEMFDAWNNYVDVTIDDGDNDCESEADVKRFTLAKVMGYDYAAEQEHNRAIIAANKVAMEATKLERQMQKDAAAMVEAINSIDVSKLSPELVKAFMEKFAVSA